MKKESIVFDTENKKVIFYKDCQKCVHLPVCKYREAQIELMNSSLMKEMFSYRGVGNDGFDGFDLHTNCRYFVHNLKQRAKDNPTVTNKTSHYIIDRIVDIFVHEKLYPQIKLDQKLKDDVVLHRDSFVYLYNYSIVKITINFHDENKISRILSTKEFELEHILSDWTYLDLSNTLISG